MSLSNTGLNTELTIGLNTWRNTGMGHGRHTVTGAVSLVLRTNLAFQDIRGVGYPCRSSKPADLGPKAPLVLL